MAISLPNLRLEAGISDVKIVQTADIHLSEEYPERLEALEEILQICEEEQADLLLISGDLFDADVDLEELKTDLRPLFSDNSFQTLVIPGNHDKSAYRQEDYFGDDIQVLKQKPYSENVFEEVNIVAVPYTDEGFSDIAGDLAEQTSSDKTDIMMLHCTLEGSNGSFGEESRYMPVRPAEIVQTGFDYVLAGHIHSSATRKSFGDTVFAYSGSPVSISSSETGKREVWILDTEAGLSARELDTFHYLNEKKEILPGEEEMAQKDIIENFRSEDLDNASLIVNLSGFTEESVDQFLEDMSDKIEKLGPEDFNIKSSGLQSVSSIVESKIYREFQEKMGEKDFENPKLVEKKFLRGLSRYER